MVVHYNSNLPGSRSQTCWGKRILLASSILGLVTSFTSNQRGIVSKRIHVTLSMAGESDFVNKVNFFAKEVPNPSDENPGTASGTSATFDPVTEALIRKSKAVIASDLGIQDPSLLAEDFLWIGPYLEKPLGKVDYLAAGRFFSLRTAFPDLDYRPHDFRMDRNDPLTVRCTVRPVGVMRGPLRLRNELVPPNGKQWRGPPEAISITFDAESGKVAKLCSGFAMDRLVGNTNGLCGVLAAATVAGVPPSEWEVNAIPTVISRFFGRPVDPLGEVSTFLAPFPETVMIQLVKGILTTNLAADDPALLSKDFTFLTPSVGPVGKAKFIESYAAQEFGGFEPEYSHFRVDPFDPYRVWVDVKLVGPGLEGPPQAFSFTFDDDGFCTRITAGAVMDPSIGNTGGLTGPAGIKYASGEGDLDFAVRPLPVAIGRLKKAVLSPLTKISADDYVLDASQITEGRSKEDSDTLESRRALAEARARIREEEAQRKQIEAEAAERLRALQEMEEQKLRAQQEALQQADEDLKKIRMEIEKEVSIREAESRQVPVPVEKPEVKLPTPPKIPPPPQTIIPKAVAQPKPTALKPSPPKTVPPSDSKGGRPSPTSKSISSFGIPLSIPISDILPKFDGIPGTNVDSKEETKKESVAEVRIKEKARLDEQAAATAKLKAVFEESRRKRIEEQKIALEQKKLDLEKRKAAAAEALARKNAEINAAVAMRKAEEDKKKLEAEKKRQESISKGTEALAGALSAIQAQPYPMAKKDVPIKKAPKPPTTRPSLQIGARKATNDKDTPNKAQPSAPRPSLRIPELSKPATDVKPKVPPPAPRPSFQISIFGKPSEPTIESKVSPPIPSKPRPSLQIPKLPTIGAQDQSKSMAPKPKPPVAIPNVTPQARPSLQIPKATKAPKGVPTIVAWRVLPSGGISGQIFGSINFKEGERIETSTIATGRLENGSVVTTESGSKYFLSAQSVRDMRAASAAATATTTTKSTPKVVATDVASSPPRATLQLTKLAKERDAKAAKLALEAASQAPKGAVRRRPTFSLSAFFGFDKSTEPKETSKTTPASTKSAVPPASKGQLPLTKVAPRGIPSINRWKQNRDKSITGIITGSPAFPDGEKITTSPISGGVIRSGQVVTTSSGTKYFLQ